MANTANATISLDKVTVAGEDFFSLSLPGMVNDCAGVADGSPCPNVHTPGLRCICLGGVRHYDAASLAAQFNIKINPTE